MENENLRIIQDFYALFAKDPVAGTELFFRLMDDNIRWHSVADESQPGLKFARDRNSKSEVLEYFQELAREWEMLEIAVDHFTAQDDRVIVCGTGVWRHQPSGTNLTMKKADVIRLHDGKIVEFTEFFDTAKVNAVATHDSSKTE